MSFTWCGGGYTPLCASMSMHVAVHVCEAEPLLIIAAT